MEVDYTPIRTLPLDQVAVQVTSFMSLVEMPSLIVKYELGGQTHYGSIAMEEVFICLMAPG